MRRSALVFLGALLVGCGSAPPDCLAEPQAELARVGDQALRCEEADVARVWLEVLGGRGMSEPHRRSLYGALRDHFRADPTAAKAQLAAVRQAHEALQSARGFEAAQRRSTEAFEVVSGEGPFGEQPTLLRAAERAILPRARDAATRLVLTEGDVEGWIRYISLCREAQGAGALALSVSDRVQLYHHIRERFEEATPDEKRAMVAVGAWWWSLRARWQGASPEQQRAWAESAPMPPPMTATSLGYAETLLQGEVIGHAHAVHEAFGPLPLGLAP